MQTNEAASGDNDEELKTLYVINTNTGIKTELVSPKLEPTFGCAISENGCRVACVTSNKTIRVWSPWASEGMIPDLSLLKMNERLNSDSLNGLLIEHGPALINMPDSTCMPLTMQLVHAQCGEELDWMVEWLQRSSDAANAGVTEKIKVRYRS